MQLVETIVYLVVGAGIPIVTFIINKHYESIKLESEEKRWYAEPLLRLKIETIRDFQLTSENNFFLFTKHLDLPPHNTMEFNEKLSGKVEEYRDKMELASIYFNEKQKEIFKKMKGLLEEASLKIYRVSSKGPLFEGKRVHTESVRDFNRGTFRETHNQTVQCFKELLNPESLTYIMREK